MERLKACVSGRTIVSPTSFRRQAVRPSSPHDFEGARSFNKFETVSGVVSVRVNVGGQEGGPLGYCLDRPRKQHLVSPQW